MTVRFFTTVEVLYEAFSDDDVVYSKLDIMELEAKSAQGGEDCHYLGCWG